MLTTAGLKSRGWTDVLIRLFLPNPDDTKPNPRFAKAAPMKLYKRNRVEKCEASPQFAEKKQKADRRKQSAKKGVETKAAKMEEFIEGLTIEIPDFEKDELIAKARKNFHSSGHSGDTSPSDEQMCVNYLRHCESKYESCLAQIAGSTGSRDAYIEIKGKVLEAIAEKYEWLAEECDQQLKRAWKKHSEEFL